MSTFNRMLDRVTIAIREFTNEYQSATLMSENESAGGGSQLRTFCGVTEPRDTVIVVDVSASMDEADYPPTRLHGGIQAAIEYVNARAETYPQDRVALVSFSIEARVVLPLSAIDAKEKIVPAIQSLRIDGGTDIAAGLKAAARVFGRCKESDHHRHIVLLTDGHGGRPVKIAKKLKDYYQAVIDVVGIGGSHSAVNESLLRRIASTDPVDGFNHYRFIKDPETLKEHYRNLATGLVWRGDENDRS